MDESGGEGRLKYKHTQNECSKSQFAHADLIFLYSGGESLNRRFSSQKIPERKTIPILFNSIILLPYWQYRSRNRLIIILVIISAEYTIILTFNSKKRRRLDYIDAPILQ